MKKVIADKIRQRDKGTMPVSQKDSMADPQPKIDYGRIRHQWLVASMGPGEIERCIADVREGRVYTFKNITTMLHCSKCQYRLKIPHSAGRKVCHPPEKMVESFSRLIENETGW